MKTKTKTKTETITLTPEEQAIFLQLGQQFVSARTQLNIAIQTLKASRKLGDDWVFTNDFRTLVREKAPQNEVK